MSRLAVVSFRLIRQMVITGRSLLRILDQIVKKDVMWWVRVRARTDKERGVDGDE